MLQGIATWHRPLPALRQRSAIAGQAVIAKGLGVVAGRLDVLHSRQPVSNAGNPHYRQRPKRHDCWRRG